MEMGKQSRRKTDTRLESEGAEFLVLGHLLVEGIQAYKSYVNYPGYDVIAVNPKRGRICRIQVKSRWATDFNRAFSIRNFGCAFVVLAALNRGYRYQKRKTRTDSGRQPPQLYVLPVAVVKGSQDPKSGWGMVRLACIENLRQYENT